MGRLANNSQNAEYDLVLYPLTKLIFLSKYQDNCCDILGKYNLEMDNGNEIQEIVTSVDLEKFENHASRRRPLFM